MVRNKRQWGSHDWSTPGGVIDASDLGVVEGLTREVQEETGILVTDWEGPVYEVVARATDMGWEMRCEVYVAREFEGDIRIDDPDGIVVDAAFVELSACAGLLEGGHPWVCEPLLGWIDGRWDASAFRTFRYRILGTDPATLRIARVDE